MEETCLGLIDYTPARMRQPLSQMQLNLILSDASYSEYPLLWMSDKAAVMRRP